MNVNKLFVVLFIILPFVKARGQEFSPLALSMNYLHNTRDPKPLVANCNFVLHLPFYRDSMFVGLFGGSFKYFQVNLSKDSFAIHDLYSVSIPFTGVLRLSFVKLITFSFEPIIGTDFEDLNIKNLRFNTVIFYRFSNRGKSSWGAGLVASKRFSGFLIVPLAFFNIKFSDKWLLSGTFPAKQKLSYLPDKTKQIGISLEAGSNSFRLSKSKESRYIDSQQLGANCFYQQLIVKHIGMEISLGIQSFRSFVYNQNQTLPVTIFPFNFNKSDNAIYSFTNTGLQFRVGFFYSVFGSK